MIRDHVEIIAKETLDRMNLFSEQALSLIMATGQAESHYKHLKQIKGPAIGFFQMEPATARDILNNYVVYRPKYKDALDELGFCGADLEFGLLSNIALQVAFCRLHYRRVPKPLPKTHLDQAHYWKAYYNTHLGRGTVEHFMKANGYES